jgi:hypothetical protein
MPSKISKHDFFQGLLGEAKMRNRIITWGMVTLLVTGLAAPVFGDIKITVKTSAMGHSFEGTTYIKGSRERTENPGGMVTIYQCDQKRMIQINDIAKTYMIVTLNDESESATPASGPPAGAAQPEAQPQPAGPSKARHGGDVTFTNTITDTGERKQIFGYTAKHIKTVVSKEASADACDPEPFKMETDGWYIDFQYSFHCSTGRPPAIPTRRGGPTARPDCVDTMHFKRSGAIKLGYPVQVTNTIYAKDGRTISTSTEVTNLSTATLDDSLFDVPAGYTEGNSYKDMAAAAMASAMAKSQAARQGGPAPDAASTTPGAKSQGGIRVGVVGINNKTDQTVSLDSQRDHLIGGINGSNVDAITIDATSADAIQAEAREKQCDYILYTDVSSLKKPSTAAKIGGILGRHQGIGGPQEQFEARVEFKLFPVGAASPALSSDGTAKEQGNADTAVSSALDKEIRSVQTTIKNKK